MNKSINAFNRAINAYLTKIGYKQQTKPLIVNKNNYEQKIMKLIRISENKKYSRKNLLIKFQLYCNYYNPVGFYLVTISRYFQKFNKTLTTKNNNL